MPPTRKKCPLKRRKPILIGKKCQFGEIVGLHTDGFERMYFCKDKDGVISFMPESAIEVEEDGML